MSNQALWIIANPKTTEKELIAAIRSLPKRPDEPPSYWTKIGNDRSFSPLHRRRVLSQLFRRHVKVGMSLQELAKVLDYPHWLQKSTFREINLVGGVLPLDFVDGDVIFSIHFLSEIEHEHIKVYFGAYFRVHREVNAEDFTNLLLGKRRTNIGKNVIAEIYHFPK